MNPLSKRVGDIMHTNIILEMTPSEKIAFTTETASVTEFADLSDATKETILKAEQQLKK